MFGHVILGYVPLFVSRETSTEMENYPLYKKNLAKISCEDIYSEEIDKSLRTLKRFREAWLRSAPSWNSELFQYADSDFYFYRFAIDRQEKNTELFLTSILFRMMERYGISYEIPEEKKNAPFIFIICQKENRIGYRLDDFFSDEDINSIVQSYNLAEAVILRTWKPGKPDEWISRENEQHRRENLKLKSISIESFFNQFFSPEEYRSFTLYIERYLQEARDLTGYKSIKFLSSMNLATQKIFEGKELESWDYRNYSFQIIDKTNKKIQDYLYLPATSFPSTLSRTMEKNYLTGELFKAMIGNSEYAESFITSEWLYHSLRGEKNFDYTSVISGYLKSVEQLLFKIVMLNVDNNCKITMSGANDVITAAISNNVVTYKRNKGKWKVVSANDNSKGYKYIDLTSTQTQYMDSSIGTFEYFLRNNPHIFEDPYYYKTIADMVCCFRTECRNGFFHTHNLKDWNVVKKTRSNAIFLYYVLLGGCIIPNDKVSELGISAVDGFDELCKKIRKFRDYNTDFIFEYTDGKRSNLVYDFINNTIEYTNEGIEHYERLIFYEVDDFSLETYKKLETGIREDQKVYLTRDSLPIRIYGVHKDKRLEEIVW